MDREMYLTIHGIPKNTPPHSEVHFYFTDLGGWQTNSHILLYNLEELCIQMYDKIYEIIVGHKEGDELLDYCVPKWVTDAGHSAESTMSAASFKECIQQIPDNNKAILHSLLYAADCQKLVSSIQDIWQQVFFLMGEFYLKLNTLHTVSPQNLVNKGEGVVAHYSYQSSAAWSLLESIYIRLYSMLDYNAKIAHEFNKLHKEFTRYPRMSSKDTQYRDIGDLNFTEQEIKGTLFESNPLINEVRLIRNQIIHNGFLDSHPRVYLIYKLGVIVEKFILMPDIDDGKIHRYVNRNLFYSKEDRVNIRLPNMVNEILKLQIDTLTLLLSKF